MQAYAVPRHRAGSGSVEPAASGYLLALPAFLLTGLMLGSIGLFLSSLIRQLENFASVMNFVIFPMFFASSALYPLWRIREASETLYWICMANPFTHAVELVKVRALRTLRADRLRRGGRDDDRSFFLAASSPTIRAAG